MNNCKYIVQHFCSLILIVASKIQCCVDHQGINIRIIIFSTSIRKNSNSRYREGEPILHVKEIVEGPIYPRRPHVAAVKQIHPQKDKVTAQNAHLEEIDEVRNDIYRASKKNFMTTRKTADVLNYYDSLIKM